MDYRQIHALIDTYDLKACLAVLLYSAPDLFDLVVDEVKLRRDAPQTLQRVREATHEAVRREEFPI